MTVDQCNRAFDRFWRADSTKDGSGLGLAIVKHLVELSGGSATLKPGRGGSGVVATVRLPRPKPTS
jgi:signal transduction histidine kinase